MQIKHSLNFSLSTTDNIIRKDKKEREAKMVVDGIGVKAVDISNTVSRVQDTKTKLENIEVNLQEEKGINKEEVNDKLADKNSRKELDEDTLIK